MQSNSDMSSVVRAKRARRRRELSPEAREATSSAPSPSQPPPGRAGAADDMIDCLCGDAGEFGTMIGCDSCLRWHHAGCLRLSAPPDSQDPFTCPVCLCAGDRAKAVALYLLPQAERMHEVAGELADDGLSDSAATSTGARGRKRKHDDGDEGDDGEFDEESRARGSAKRRRHATSPRASGGPKRAEDTRMCIVPGCTYRCRYISLMVIHCRKHTQEKPFRCPYPSCAHQCSQKANLKTHYRNCHLDNVSMSDPDLHALVSSVMLATPQAELMASQAFASSQTSAAPIEADVRAPVPAPAPAPRAAPVARGFVPVQRPLAVGGPALASAFTRTSASEEGAVRAVRIPSPPLSPSPPVWNARAAQRQACPWSLLRSVAAQSIGRSTDSAALAVEVRGSPRLLKRPISDRPHAPPSPLVTL